MQELTLAKKLKIIKLYLDGFSYDEIAAKCVVSKGTVANVIAALKDGQFPEISGTVEELEQLRELAVQTKHAGLSPAQATIGLSVLSKLNDMGLEPAEIYQCHTLLKVMTSPDGDLKAMAHAVIKVEGLRENTGLSFQELEVRASELKKELAKLEPLSQEVEHTEKQLADLGKVKEKLQDEVNKLNGHLKELKEAVVYSEEREGKLSTRVAELEKRAYEADKELQTARQDLKDLNKIGVSLEDLSKFNQKVKAVAAHHDLKPEELTSRLLYELKQLDKGLGLGSAVKDKKAQLAAVGQDIEKAEAEKGHLAASNNQLNSERTKLEAQLAESRKHLVEDIAAVEKATKLAIGNIETKLKSGINSSLVEVDKLKEQAIEAGEELGKLEANIRSYDWIKSLLSLVKGDNGLDNCQVRVAGLTVLRSVLAWINKLDGQDTSLFFLKNNLATAISGLENWK